MHQNGDAAQSGIDAIGKRDVDHAILAAEIQRGLATMLRQLFQATAAAAGKNQCNGVVGGSMQQPLTFDRRCARRSCGLAGGAQPYADLLAPKMTIVRHAVSPRRKLRTTIQVG